MDEPGLPVEVELVPGQLSASVHLHEFGPPGMTFPLWSFISRGLAVRGQKEVIFSVRRRPGEPAEAYPPDPLRFFSMLFQVAGEGRVVDLWGFTGLTVGGLLGRMDFNGVLYVQPDRFPELDLPDELLAGVFVSMDELEVAMQAGSGRILARLARLLSCFPYPPFTDRDRALVSGPDEMRRTVLGPLARRVIKGASVRFGPEGVGLRLTRLAAEDLLAAVGDGSEPFGLITDPATDRRPRLVWSPDETSPIEVIAPPDPDPRYTNAHFLIFQPGSPSNRIVAVEDGFGVELTPEAWEEVRRGTEMGEPVSVQTDQEILFRVEFQPVAYRSPMGDVYVSEGWEQFSPKTPSPPRQGPIQVVKCVLLTPMEQVSKSVTVRELGDYINSLVACIETFFHEFPPSRGHDCIARVALGEGSEARVSISLRSDVEAAHAGIGSALTDRLSAIRVPTTRAGPVTFEVLLTIGGGSGLPFG